MTDVMQMSQSYSQYSNLYAYQQQVCSFLLLKTAACTMLFYKQAFLGPFFQDLEFFDRF